MRKNYDTPELEMFIISNEDVLNVSTQDVDDPYAGAPDAGWFA